MRLLALPPDSRCPVLHDRQWRPRVGVHNRAQQKALAVDVIFPADGAHAYLRDLPGAELHLLDSGHFALEDKGDEIAALMLDFLAKLPRR